MQPESVAEMFPDDAGPMTVRQLADHYLQLGCDNCCETTMQNKRHHLKLFVQAHGPRPVASLKPLDIIAFLQTNPRWAAWHIRGVLANLKAMFNFGVRMELISRNPAQGIKKPPGRRRRSATPAEFRALIRHSPNIRFRQLIFMLGRTGMRYGEVAGLKWDAVDFEHNVIRLVNHKTRSKTHEDRIIPMTRVIRGFLLYLQRNTPVGLSERLRKFCSVPRSATEVGAFLAPHTVREVIVKVAIKMAGVTIRRNDAAKNSWLYEAIDAPRVPGQWVYEVSKHQIHEPGRYFDYVLRNVQNHPWSRTNALQYVNALRRRGVIARDCRLHGVRHLFVSTAIERGVPIRIAGALAGHRDVRTTEIYNHMPQNIDLLRGAMETASAPPVVKRRKVARRLSALVGSTNGGNGNGHANGSR